MNVIMRLGLRSVFWRAMNASVRRSRFVAPASGAGHSQTGKQVSDLAASQAMVGVRQHGSDFLSTPWDQPPGRSRRPCRSSSTASLRGLRPARDVGVVVGNSLIHIETVDYGVLCAPARCCSDPGTERDRWPSASPCSTWGQTEDRAHG